MPCSPRPGSMPSRSTCRASEALLRPMRCGARPEYAAAVGLILDEMAAQVVVLGHSFGGRVAVHLAATRPATVAGSC